MVRSAFPVFLFLLAAPAAPPPLTVAHAAPARGYWLQPVPGDGEAARK